MQISFKNQSIERKNSEVCIVTEPRISDETIDFVTVKITGRYPNAKYVTNQKCKEIVYISEGRGKVVVDGKEYALNAGDVVLIEPGEKFYWEGNMGLSISCRPAWTKEQHVVID
ncbi:MAG: cupin domain-containing protein [Pseudomonadota bacterium]